VVAAAAVVMQLGLGAIYAWSVFREPLSIHYDTGITQVNVAFFLAILLIGFAAPLIVRPPETPREEAEAGPQAEEARA